ncbi:thiol reductant ABC exporter subunit CydD [Ameyamaea chiangmaiensis]|uniref:Thiol reductant ABC exporter subunit CydD n=1 Tax=Ameyamaea chiangmaiensis TaxID=442969 RepID=A0A850P7U0_9PROT|nr:thiol reductant ABC exporter subunit CydD [Ameyamaea chiangmaiensis]MBS4073659.1 thiol reductant ABC exporter subunit CydD [Ameyamaea chiangmaiensis]NVN39073.1 thiol reductant ABC exporter subunit CydD [Ameyamaea chiangmaiensis]
MSRDKQIVRAWTRAQARLGRRNARPVIAAGLVGTLIACAQAACIAALLGPVLAGHAAAMQIVWPLAGFGCLAIVRAMVLALGDIAAGRAGARARRRLRQDIVQTMLSAGPVLLRRAHSGALAALAFDRVEALDGFFARWIPASILWVAQPVLVVCVVAFVAPHAALVMALCGLFVPFAQAAFGIGAAVASRRQFLAMTRLQARFLDRIRGIATIVLAGRADDEAERLAAAAAELRKRTMTVLRVAFLSSAAIDLAMVVALVLITLGEGHGLVAQRAAGTLDPASVGRALFALVLVPEFFAPLRALALAYQDRAQASGAAESIHDLFGAETVSIDADEGRQSHDVPCTPGEARPSSVSVRFERVSFSWDADRGASLSDVSFRMDARQTLLLCGASGAGKSTIMELLLGFVSPMSGRILFNECDVAEMSSAQRARYVAWIGQRPVLFAGTIADNLRLARPEASDEALEHALAMASADFVSALPQGIHTVIGDGGFGLSGGQAQRIAIARAFLKNAPLLLLDEPTAHLDPATERAIFDTLARLAEGRTVILASHSHAISRFGAQRLDLVHGRVLESRVVA